MSVVINDDDDSELDNTSSGDEFATTVDEDIEKLLDTVVIDSNNDAQYDCTASDILALKKTKTTRKIKDSLINIHKKYFSSLNARTVKYGLFNYDENHVNSIIMVSSKRKTTFEDYLFQYHPSDLSIQIVHFKDTTDLDILKDRFKISDKRTLISIDAIRKNINIACKQKDTSVLPMKTASDDKGNLFLKVRDIDTDTDIIERYGFLYNNWRTISILNKRIYKMEHIVDEDTTIVVPLTYEQLEKCTSQNITIIKIDTAKFIKDGQPIYKDFPDDHQTVFILLDGKDIPAVKEYIKKLKNPYTLDIKMVIPDNDNHIFYTTRYSDDTIDIISGRPFLGIYPFTLKSTSPS